MSLQLSDKFSNTKSHAVITSPCSFASLRSHVERPRGKTCYSVSLDCSTLNGVETSVTVNRCFDSVYYDLTLLRINLKCSASVAQHDKCELNEVYSQYLSIFQH
jgi:hypothetical protein